MGSKRALLLFPPNWSAAVAAPHLALPLLAGVARDCGWDSETWDLSATFYATTIPPEQNRIAHAAKSSDWTTLDDMYFEWEDRLRECAYAQEYGPPAGLLSGFRFDGLRHLSLREAFAHIRGRSPYTSFIQASVVPRLLNDRPDVIGVTIASELQILPALELLEAIKTALPMCFIVLGGNVVTRLRQDSSFFTFLECADQVVTFQGEAAWRKILDEIALHGVRSARERLPRATSGDRLPTCWPCASFRGIDFAVLPGTASVSVVSTRGCYWGKCSFCAIPAGWSPSGYAGSLAASEMVGQLTAIAAETGIPRFKFVDEAMAPAKARAIGNAVVGRGLPVEWEVYARLERNWDEGTLRAAHRGGLRKIYFGLEQVETSSRAVFGKGDRANPEDLVQMCSDIGIAVHLFCMVGHPRTSIRDAQATVEYLLTHAKLIDTADLVGFRLDRGTVVDGIRARPFGGSDWQLSYDFDPLDADILGQDEVSTLEASSQEALWQTEPRLLHPLYRLLGSWSEAASGAFSPVEARARRDGLGARGLTALT